MRVLIIRPEVQAKHTADKLTALGHDAVKFPLFHPVHDLAHLADALRSRYSALAITSAEAARCLRALGPELKPYLGTTIFTVGRSTARMAKEAGFTDVVSAGGTGNDLAGLVAGFAAGYMEAKPVLYLAGHKRSGIFEDTLRDNDIDCVTAEIYDMERISYTTEKQQQLLVNQPVDAAFLFSRENAKAFFELEIFRQSKESLRKTLFFCLSRNIAEAVPGEFRESVFVSSNPDEDELLHLI